jgi:hypothetical protein
MDAYKQAQELMWSNAVSVRIYPLNLADEPMSEWEWDVEITIPNNQWRGSNEDGNFIVHQQGIDSFSSLESAFQWAYKWLKGRGYDVSNIEFDMKSTAHDGIIKNSDLAKVREAREVNA